MEENVETFEIEDLIIIRNIAKWGCAKPRKQFLKSVVALLTGFISAYLLFKVFYMFLHYEFSFLVSFTELILLFGTFGGGCCAAMFSWKLAYYRLLTTGSCKYIADLIFTLIILIFIAVILFSVFFLVKKYHIIIISILIMPLLPFTAVYWIIMNGIIIGDIGDLLKYIYNKIKGNQ